MQVYLDDEQVRCDRSTLASALRAARDAAESRGRVIIEATLDGEPVPGDLLATPPDAEVSAGELRFLSAEPGALVRTILLDVAELLPAAGQAQRQAQELLETGEIARAGEHLGEALEVWVHVPEATLQGCRLLGLDIETLRLQTGTDGNESEPVALHGAIAKLGELLREVRRAQQDADWPALADVVGYDLCEQATHWEAILRRLADRANAPDGANA